MYEPPGRYDVIIRVASDGGQLPDPEAFAAAADRAAFRRSASVVTVQAPGWYAARAVARAVVSDALERQAPSSNQSDGDAGRLDVSAAG